MENFSEEFIIHHIYLSLPLSADGVNFWSSITQRDVMINCVELDYAEKI